MKDLAPWNGSLHGVEETDKLLMPMLFRAASDYGSGADVERAEPFDRLRSVVTPLRL